MAAYRRLSDAEMLSPGQSSVNVYEDAESEVLPRNSGGSGGGAPNPGIPGGGAVSTWVVRITSFSLVLDADGRYDETIAAVDAIFTQDIVIAAKRLPGFVDCQR